MSSRTPSSGPAEDAPVAPEPDSAEDRLSVRSQWPLLIGLTLVWGALWQDFSPGVLLMGAVFSLAILWFYRLPRVKFSGRVNPWYVLVFTARFLWRIIVASLEVAWDAIVKGPRIVNSVVAVHLRSHDDLIVTLTGHALALIPGSLVVDVDRPSSTLYLHCLDVTNEEEVEHFRQEALATEAAIIRAIGSREDLELVRAGERGEDTRRTRSSDEEGRP